MGGDARARLGLSMADGRRESWLESYSFVRLDRLGVPGWRAQVLVLDAGGELLGRVDGLWEDCAVVAEVDGRGKYLDGVLGPTGEHAAQAVIAEKVREDAIRDVGLEMVRWDLAELLQRPLSWPRGSSAHGPGAAGPASAAGSSTDRAPPPPLPPPPDRTHRSAGIRTSSVRIRAARCVRVGERGSDVAAGGDDAEPVRDEGGVGVGRVGRRVGAGAVEVAERRGLVDEDLAGEVLRERDPGSRRRRRARRRARPRDVE